MSTQGLSDKYRAIAHKVSGWLEYRDYELVVWLFLRALGVIYLIAFASLMVQVKGLVGEQGIMPVGYLLDYVTSVAGEHRYYRLPTIFWLAHGNLVLVAVALYGCIVSLQILFNRWLRPALIIAFILYLSLYNVCQPFLHFQWDGLLLEAGFLAIFLGFRSSIIIWLFRLLLFKLRFMSGLSKLTSGDPQWSGLTALNTYFEVQPLPNPVAWYFHHLPELVLRAGTAATLVIEILVPFMMFMPRPWRFAAAWITIFWQLLIMLTSNHNWINLLTIVLCLFLFDDRAVRRVVPISLKPAQMAVTTREGMAAKLRTAMLALMALAIVTISTAQLWILSTRKDVFEPLATVIAYMDVYRVVNMYHVFPTMTTERIELEVSGSIDGKAWRTYRFKHKPQDLDRRPGLVMPHQPRLDWQMWFVTLRRKHLPWFEEFLYALLDNSPHVKELLANDPFPGEAPRYIRVDAYKYTFTTPEQREQTGNWWNKEAQGPFLPLPGVMRSE